MGRYIRDVFEQDIAQKPQKIHLGSENYCKGGLELNIDVFQARQDPVKRNIFLAQQREFVRKTASVHCRRPLEWGRDEELSIALIALDTAVDAYLPDKNAKFTTFASLVIRRRLTDYLRNRSRRAQRELPVDELPEWKSPEPSEDMLRMERAWELEEFQRQISRYNISFKELAKESPRHQQVRSRLLRAIATICRDQKLLQTILDRGRLPLEQMSELTGETKKALSKRRRYLLAALLVHARRADFPFIATYLGLGGEEDAQDRSDL